VETSKANITLEELRHHCQPKHVVNRLWANRHQETTSFSTKPIPICSATPRKLLRACSIQSLRSANVFYTSLESAGALLPVGVLQQREMEFLLLVGD